MHLKYLPQLFIILFSCFVAAQPGDRQYLIPKDTVIVRNGTETIMTINYNGTNYKQVQRYRHGLKNGLQEIFNTHGTLIENANYKDGFINGEQTLYDNSGKVREKSRYKYSKKQKRSTLEGKKQTYNNNILISEYSYKDSLLDGPFTKYDYNGKIQQEGSYKENLLNGRNITYYTDGKVKIDANYTIIADEKGKKSAVLQGSWKSYNPNGKLSMEGAYSKGKKVGLWREWHAANGQLAAETEYKDGKKYGAYKKYSPEGKLQGIGILYEEIEIDGQKRTNVQDGHIESYYTDGKIQSSNDYKMGKPHGTWKYYANDGSLQSERHFKDGLETGTSLYYTKGIKSLETNFAVIDKDRVATSVKHGTETNWTNGVVTAQTHYVNGVAQGTAKSFFANGNPESIINFNNGKLEGPYLYYHDNGQLRYRKTYTLRKQYDGSVKSEVTGWDEEFDREGRIISKKFLGQKENILVNTQYADGVPQAYEAGKRLEVTYFPDGKPMSVKILGTGTFPLAFYFYRNGNLRKMKFDDLASLSSLTAEFNDKGNVLSVYDENQGANKTVKANVSVYANAVNKDWASAPLLTEINKNGRYQLAYSHGRTFLEMNFKEGLPHGTFVVYEPVRGDTLVYANFKEGLPEGKFVEKFAGTHILSKGVYHANGEKAEHYRYKADGRQVYYQLNDTLGHMVADAQYYENGKMSSRHNNANGTRAYYGQDGNVISETALVPGENTKVRREFYPGTKQLKRETFCGPTGDSGTDTGYHANGKLQFKLYNKDNKREGPYVSYDDKGNLLTEGMYVNGEMQGEWTTYKDGKAETDYYEKGKRQVGPPEKSCGCADTSIAHNDIKFVPTLNTLATYKSVQNYLPPYLIPAEEFNYEWLFYSNLQTSNGNNGGFAAMRLLPLKPLAFYLPADKQVKVTLTPCATKGYVSNMEVNSNYSFNNEEQSTTTIYPKRIMLELPGSPLKGSTPDYKDFTMLFDVKSVSLNNWKLDIDTATQPNTCYSAGIIKDFLNITVLQAEPWLFQDNPHRYYYPEGNSGLTAEELNRNTERDNFFGIRINNATVSFNLAGKTSATITARGEQIYAGGKFVSGSIFITCSEDAATGVYTSVINGTPVTFTQDSIKKQWAQKGFTRLETQYNTRTGELQLNFFAE